MTNVETDRRPRLRSALLSVTTAAAISALAACTGGADVGSDSAAATDSFVSPTEHGELMFGAPNRATFDGSHRFHSWTFALSGDATFSIRTEPYSQNLDTVMYLYGRAPGDDSWGSNVDKNDDHEGQIWSQIDGIYGAGEYRIIVKAIKTTFTGDFGVLASCDGEGCPAASGGSCSPDLPAELPSTTEFTEGCTSKFTDILLTPVAGQYATEIDYSKRCDAGGLIARSIDYYRGYWERHIDWEEMTNGEEPTMMVEVTEHGEAGKVVAIDMDADEDLIEFVYDGFGELVMYFHHASYSEEGWFCGKAGEAAADAPADYSEDCAGYAISSLEHETGSEESGQGTTSLGSPAAGLPEFLRYVPMRFADEVAFEHEDDPIEYSYEMWTSLDSDQAALLTLSAQGTTMTYLVGEQWGDGGYVYVEIDADGGQRFVCDEGLN
jgi:hypothetical protein